MTCPYCGTRLTFTQRSSQRIGAIAGLTFAGIIIHNQGKMLVWPTFGWFMLFAFVYGHILFLFIGTLTIAPAKISFDPYPNRSGVWKIISISSLIVMFVIGLSGFLWKYLPSWAVLTMVAIMFPSSLCVLISAADTLVGRNGILRKDKKFEPPTPPCSANRGGSPQG